MPQLKHGKHDDQELDVVPCVSPSPTGLLSISASASTSGICGATFRLAVRLTISGAVHFRENLYLKRSIVQNLRAQGAAIHPHDLRKYPTWSGVQRKALRCI